MAESKPYTKAYLDKWMEMSKNKLNSCNAFEAMVLFKTFIIMLINAVTIVI